MDKLDRFIDVISLIVIFSCMIYMVLLLLKNIDLKERLDQIPKDNQLIQVNDTLYYRTHVRIDTTYFVRK
jgi:hypothetical protein